MAASGPGSKWNCNRIGDNESEGREFERNWEALQEFRPDGDTVLEASTEIAM